MSDTFILSPIIVPIVAGIILEIIKKTEKTRMNLFVAAVLVIEAVLVFINTGRIGSEVTLFSITDNLPIYFKIDNLGIMFAILMVVIWLLAGIFSFEYMKHEDNERRYQGFYLMFLGVLI